MNKRIVLAGLAAVLSVAGLGMYLKLRSRPEPARELYRKALPAWQTARFRPNTGGPDSKEARALIAAADRWPGLRTELARIDSVWPDDAAVRAAAEATNRAAQAAGLGYFIDVQNIRQRPILLTYEVAHRTTWQAGERKIELLRLRRLDSLNVELAMLGETQGAQPRVLLDRIEATLARELPLMYPVGGKPAPSPPNYPMNEVDHAALMRLRAYLESKLGAGELALAVEKLRARDELLESMRARFHRGSVQFSRPDGFVLGEAWVESMEPYTRLDHPGGPLMLDTDLRRVARADEELRDGSTAETLRRAIDHLAAITDVHEVRHALDVEPPPPPAALLELFPPQDERFPKMASLEMRAYLAELHHGAPPPCVIAAKLVRTVYGAGARRTPHFFAGFLILRELTGPKTAEGAETAAPPVEQLATLCGLPEPSLRTRAADLWQKLYGQPLQAALVATAP